MVLVIVLAGGLVYRAWRQAQAAAIMTLSMPDAIDETTFLPVGNTRQGISIRGS